MRRRAMLLLLLSAIVAGWMWSHGGRSDIRPVIASSHSAELKRPLEGLVQLVVMPPNARLTVTRFSGPRVQGYQVIGTFAGQGDRDVTNEVNWKIDNGAIGAVTDKGRFTTSNRVGGQGIITAYSGSVNGTAQITIVDVSQRIPESFPAPANR